MTKSGIKPSPLYNETLQPRDPPASATPQALGLFERLLLRRTAQLNLLPLRELQSAFTLLEGSPLLTKYLDQLFQDLPEKKPTTDPNEYTSVIKYLLCEFFYKSVDSRIKGEHRKLSLDRFQEILRILDVIYTDYTETIGKDPIQKSQFKQKQRLEFNRLGSKDQSKPTSAIETTDTNKGDEKNSSTVVRKSPEAKDPPKGIDQVLNSLKSNFQSSVENQASDQSKELTGKNSSVTQTIREEDAQKDNNMGNIRSQTNNTNDDDDDSSIEIIEHSKPHTKGSTVPNGINLKVKNEHNGSSDMSTTSQSKSSSAVHTEISPLDDTHLNSALKKIRAPGMSERKLRPPDFSTSHLGTLMNKRIDVMIPSDVQQINSNFTASNSLSQFSRKNPVRCITSKTEYNTNAYDFDCRFEKWEPYWNVCDDLTKVKYMEAELGSQTTACSNQHIKSVWNFNGNLSEKCSKIWLAPKEDPPKDGEQRLILRCLPLKIKEEYKTLRADIHLWPKGTLLEVNDRVIALQQRKQQSHDHSLWKGLSYPLDVTRYVSPSKPIKMTIGSKDSDLYGIQLAICEYISADTLFKRCMTSEDSRSIEKLKFDEAKALWQKYLEEHKVVVLDNPDEEDESDRHNQSTHTVCSLLCTVSKTPIKVPVRGKNCHHMQCFDLSVYLKTNEPISGPRWRCAVCEDFVAVEDLVVDGFLQRILDEHGEEISASRDKVRIHRDGTWNLLEDSESRNTKKRKICRESSDEGIAKTMHLESAIEIE